MNKKNHLMVLIIILNLAIFNNVSAQTTCVNGEDPPCDEQATFISVAPDALFLLDFSGSMADSPAGDNYSYGSSTSCVADTTNCTGHYGHCSGGFCNDNYTGCNVDCSKQAILKRAIFNILDYDNNNIINDNDSTSMNVRIGYMRFKDGDDTSGNYSSGNNKLIRGIGSKYEQIYCGSTTSCSSTTSSCTGTGECIVGTSANGGTPLASALKEAKSYLDYHKSQDNAKSCRQKFLIVISDGADTYACSGDGSECQDHMYERRREVVAATKALKDAGYKVFVVGFGAAMPDYLENTLNWMAFYGGTDNPLVANAGSTTAYNPTTVTSCGASTDQSATCLGDSTSHFQAASNDPGYLALSGYAFLAGNADALTLALNSAINKIRQSVYTFSQASVQAVRTQDENFLYEASFEPVNADPFWIGHLKKYQLDNNGNITPTALWDAGTVLSTMDASSRQIFTLKGGAKTSFDTTNILKEDVAETTNDDRDMVVNFVRNGETSPEFTNWRLGDIFHSFPVTIGTPSLYYFDMVEQTTHTCNNPANPSQTCKAFDLYRDAHPRESANGKRIIVIGADDGQLHAFQTNTGAEAWSFIPPNFRSKLKTIAHPAHPTADGTSLLSHEYFMDGFVSYGEVWLGTGTGQSKSLGEWNTLMIAGEGRGGSTNLWSQSPYCDSNFNNRYVTTAVPPVSYPNYCGYYAFNLTADTLNPQFSWRIGSHTALSTDDAKHLGEPWSKMIMGRVNINGNEKWVGFIGGGYSGNDCTVTTCDTSGKGFYVIDLMNGDVLWSYTHDKNNTLMAYDLAANPALLDTDSDGFVDTVYVGDLGGNVWRFKFCLQTDTSCTTNNWAGGMLFNGVGVRRPIFYMNALTYDAAGNLWIQFGTGDKTDPTFVPTDGTTDNFFAIVDKNRASTTPITLANLKNITNGTFTTADLSTYSGWVLNLTTAGEKMLSESTIFQGAIYFTTYTPGSASDPCNQGGVAKFYALDYLTATGLFTSNARSNVIGTGIPSAPIVSVGPTGVITVFASVSQYTSGSATQNINAPAGSQTCPVSPCPPAPTAGGPKGLLYYWRDLRLQ